MTCARAKDIWGPQASAVARREAGRASPEPTVGTARQHLVFRLRICRQRRRGPAGRWRGTGRAAVPPFAFKTFSSELTHGCMTWTGDHRVAARH